LEASESSDAVDFYDRLSIFERIFAGEIKDEVCDSISVAPYIGAGFSFGLIASALIFLATGLI